MKRKITQSKFRTAMLFVLMCLVMTAQADVTGTYDSSTKTLTFTGEGAVTQTIVQSIEGYDQATSVEFGSDITGIGDYAFEETNLTSVVIPSTVTEIGQFAFFNCRNLAHITIASGTTTLNIDAYAFAKILSDIDDYVETSFSCSRPFSYTTISGMYSIIYKDKYTGEESLFSKDTKLTSAVIGENVTQIPSYCFSGCTNLTTLDLTNATSLKNINTNAFSSCDITSVNIPESVESIGDCAFSGNDFTSIIIPSKVKTIGSNAFAFCSKLATITFASGTETLEIGTLAFAKPASHDDYAETSFYCDRPFTYKGYGLSMWTQFWTGVLGIFYDDTKLVKVVLGENVTSIPSYSFSGCTNLAEVTIGSNTLASKDYTTSYNLADEFRYVVNLCFDNTVSNIGEYAFYDSPYLETVELRNSTATYQTTSFDKCPKLQTIGASGIVADGLSISYSLFNKTLIISPATDDAPVAMANYYSETLENVAPWSEYAEVAENIVLKGDITSISSCAFCSFTSLKSVELSASNVTYIGESAFKGCTSLQEISFPTTLTDIRGSAFANCSSLEALNLKNTQLATIGRYAFQCDNNDGKMVEVILPNSLTTIESQAFWGCVNISKVTCYSTPTTVGNSLFSSAIKSSATLYADATAGTHPLSIYFKETMGVDAALSCGPNVTYTLSGGVLTINSSVTNAYTYNYSSGSQTPWADQASSINEIVISGTITRLGTHIFSDLPNLQKVSYNQETGVSTISDYAFANCPQLSSITLQDAVKTIGAHAFEKCSSLTSINIPYQVTTISESAFSGCGKLTAVTFPSDTKMTVIKENAFNGCTALSSINLPEGLDIIGTYAFKGCSSLTSISLPANYKVIDRYAFSGCTGLASLALPSSVIEIQAYAFEECSNLETVTTYGDSKLEKIGLFAFYNDAHLKTFIMPGRVREISTGAFNQCALEEVTLSNTLEVLGNGAFGGCKLTSVEVPSSITSLSGAFSDNTLLTDVTLPENLEELHGSFSGCTALESIELPSNLKTIDYAFGGCTNLKSIILPDSLTAIGDWTFIGCTSLTNVDIPQSVTAIGSFAFAACTSFTSVTLPDSLLTIGSGAFKQCTGLNSITLPSTLESVGMDAFIDCSNLSTVVALPSDPPTIDATTFTNCHSGLTVETLYEDTYKAAVVWRDMTIVNPYTGYAGNDVTYTVNVKDGHYVLTFSPIKVDGLDSYAIEGKNEKMDIPRWHNAPLSDVINLIDQVVIEDGITEIGENAFAGMPALKEIYVNSTTLAANTAEIGDEDLYTNAIVYTSEPDNFKTGTTWAKFNADNILPYTTGYCGISYEGYENGEAIKYTVKGHELSFETTFSGQQFINLEIDGIEMVDYASNNPAPWKKYKDYITNVNWESCPYLLNIGTYAFHGMKNVVSMEIPVSVTTLGAYAFFGCSSLTSFEIPEYVTTIGCAAFYGCTSLTSIVIPESVTTIDVSAFYNCSSLTSVVIPESVTKIPGNAFYNCSSLASVELPNSLTSIGSSAFMNCTGLTSIDIPNTVTSMLPLAFYGCTSLETVHLPEVSQTMCMNLFNNCSSLKSIKIPSQYSSFGNVWFNGCSSLNTIEVGWTTPVKASTSDFTGLPTTSDGKYDATLYVPAGYVSAYANADEWKNFARIWEVGTITLTDGEAYTNDVNQDYRKITYTRTFPDAIVNKWQCLYVPFDIDVTETLNADFDFAKLYMVSYKDTDGDGMVGDSDPLVMIWNKVSAGQTLTHNTPYFIKAKTAGTKNIAIANATLYAAENGKVECSTTEATYTLTGEYSTTDINGKYTLNGSGTFSYYNVDHDLKPYRWYMDITTPSGNAVSAKAIHIFIDGEDDPTGIAEFSADSKPAPVSVYTIDGRKVENIDNLPAGTYIINGKKVFIK